MSDAPHEVSVADVLSYDGQENAVPHAHPELFGYHMTPLLEFFGTRICGFIDVSSCRTYTVARAAGRVGRSCSIGNNCPA